MKVRFLFLFFCVSLIFFTYYAIESQILFGGPKGFLDINSSKISSVAIHYNKGHEYNFLKAENGKWELTEPEIKDVDNSLFDIFFQDLTTLPVTQTIINADSGFDSFGLHDPEVKIFITHGVDNKTTCLLFGNDNVAGTSFYAKLTDNTEVMLLGKILKDDVLNIVHLLGSKMH